MSKTKQQSGFTLVETLISLAIIALIMVGVYGIYKAAFKSVGVFETRTVATNLANKQMELLKNLPYASIGTTEGWPHGDIPSTAAPQAINNVNYTVYTDVQYVDDSYDELAPDDPYNADYKKARVWVTWDKYPMPAPVVLVTNIVPKGQESIEGGGTLSLTVVNNATTPISQVSVHVTNTNLNPNININTQTNAQGELIVPALPVDTGNNYAVTVSKAGYTSDYTTPITVADPSPVLPNQSIQLGLITEVSFTIDLVSNLTINATSTEGGGAWWDVAYQYRKKLTLQNNNPDALPANSSIKFNLDHYGLVQANKSLASGDDIRIVYFNGSSWQELDRINKTAWNTNGINTELWFQNQAEIAGSGSDANYYLYYGNSSAITPPVDLTKIFTPGKNTTTAGLYYFENGSESALTDYSGHNNNGTITNAQWAAGKSGQGLQYNIPGPWAYTTVAVPNDSSLDISGPLTLEAWVNPQDTNGKKSVIDRLNNYALWLENGHPSFGVFDQVAGLKSLQTTETVPLNTWTHVAGTYTPGQMKIYINGQEKASKVETVTFLNVNSSDMLLGNGNNFGAHASQLIGKIDEARISSAVYSSFPYSVIPNITITQANEETVVAASPIASVPLNIIGERPIGYDGNGVAIIRNKFENQITNASGQLVLSNIEWDKYTITESHNNYDLAEISPPNPVNITPGENQVVTMVLVPHADNSLRVTIVNSAKDPIGSAQVRVFGNGFDQTKTTSSAGQVFFTPLSSATYDIEVTKSGYQSVNTNQAVSGQTDREIIIAPL